MHLKILSEKYPPYCSGHVMLRKRSVIVGDVWWWIELICQVLFSISSKRSHVMLSYYVIFLTTFSSPFKNAIDNLKKTPKFSVPLGVVWVQITSDLRNKITVSREIHGLQQIMIRNRNQCITFVQYVFIFTKTKNMFDWHMSHNNYRWFGFQIMITLLNVLLKNTFCG